MKFRKKPIVVEAEQFVPQEFHWPDAVLTYEAAVIKYKGIRPAPPVCDYVVWNERAENWQRVVPGDWIIQGISGCRYPCKREIFPQIYELVEEPTKSAERECSRCNRTARIGGLCDGCFAHFG